MAKLTQEIREFIRSQHPGPNGVGNLALVGTVNEHGMPNISPRFILDIPDDETLLFGSNFTNKTYDNLSYGSRVTILMADTQRYDGYQFKGRAQRHTSGPYYEKVRESFKKAGWGDRPVEAITVRVEEVYSIRPSPSSRQRVA